MKPKPYVRLIIGDTMYEVDKYYVAGALAYERGIPWYCNPHRDGSYRHAQWNAGHENESAGDHERNLAWMAQG